MRRLQVALCTAILALAAGCGGEEGSTAEMPAALGYVAPDAYLVALVPTDLEGDQLRRFGHLLAPTLREGGGGSLRDFAAEALSENPVSFERDIEPLLGGTLVIAASGTPLTIRR